MASDVIRVNVVRSSCLTLDTQVWSVNACSLIGTVTSIFEIRHTADDSPRSSVEHSCFETDARSASLRQCLKQLSYSWPSRNLGRKTTPSLQPSDCVAVLRPVN